MDITFPVGSLTIDNIIIAQSKIPLKILYHLKDTSNEYLLSVIDMDSDLWLYSLEIMLGGVTTNILDSYSAYLSVYKWKTSPANIYWGFIGDKVLWAIVADVDIPTISAMIEKILIGRTLYTFWYSIIQPTVQHNRINILLALLDFLYRYSKIYKWICEQAMVCAVSYRNDMMLDKILEHYNDRYHDIPKKRSIRKYVIWILRMSDAKEYISLLRVLFKYIKPEKRASLAFTTLTLPVKLSEIRSKRAFNWLVSLSTEYIISIARHTARCGNIKRLDNLIKTYNLNVDVLLPIKSYPRETLTWLRKQFDIDSDIYEDITLALGNSSPADVDHVESREWVWSGAVRYLSSSHHNASAHALRLIFKHFTPSLKEWYYALTDSIINGTDDIVDILLTSIKEYTLANLNLSNRQHLMRLGVMKQNILRFLLINAYYNSVPYSIPFLRSVVKNKIAPETNKLFHKYGVV